MAFLLKDFSTILLTFLILSLSAAAFILSYFYTYWKRRGVKYLQPSIPLGNYGPSFLQKISIAELGQKLYKSTTEPFIGVYAAFRPTLLVRDPECIRRILIKDFQHFTDRGVYYDEQNDPLSAHLFAIGGEKWKNLRSKLSPTFTSGKLKAMFSTLIECGNVLQTYIDKVAEQKGNIELRELAARYNTSVIASVGFGVDINCIDNPNTSFRKYGRQFFAINLKNGLRFLAMFLFPGILKVFKIRLIDRDIEDFMMSLVKQTLEFREKNNVLRKDFFQLLVQLRNTGTVQLDDQWETVIVKDEKEKNNRLTLKEMGAQAFVFYAAGFETTSTTMSYCMYEIARNPDIQTKLHHEIDEVLAKHNGQINYDSVSEMKYLESCIDETLRKYPPVPILNRECTKDYHMPNSDLVIEQGTPINIPVYGIHHDEKYYPDPEKFDPNRFADPERVANMPYYPFGDGPRYCIGMRLGKMQTKVGIVIMMQKYKYELGDQHKNKNLSFSPAAIVLTPVSGIDLKVSPRN